MKLITFILLAFGWPQVWAQAAKMNVVFFLVDDLGYGDLGYSGSKHAQTPHIDDFAQNSTVFRSAYVAAPHCSPSRAAILTGQYPARLHMTTWIPGLQQSNFKNLQSPEQMDHLPARHNSLGKYFKSKGYATANVGKWHMGGDIVHPSEHGFDEVIGYAIGPGPGPAKAWFGPYPKIADLTGPNDEYISERLTKESVDFIQRNKEKPFFLMLQHYDVHKPFAAPQKTIDKYLELGRPKKGMECAVFLAMKEAMDDSLGKIISALKANDLYDNTIVIFSSDNGGIPGLARNAPFSEGKKSLKEGGIRVPLIMHVPGLNQGGAGIDVPVSGIDFFPTLAELSGGQAQELVDDVDGISFASLFNGAQSLPRDTLFWHQSRLAKNWVGLYAPQGVVRRGPWKMIHSYGNTQPDQLYHIKQDPGERRNLAAQFPERVEEMKALLNEHLDEVKAQRVTVK
jgi:arylsulfatase A-like enzyme